MKSRYGLALALGLLSGGCHGGGPPPAATPAQAPRPGAVAPMSPADVPIRSRAQPPVGPSLFERLGGVDAIRAVVDDFVGRVGADARINDFFRGVDLDNFKRLLTEQICQATGGPCRYTGRSMRETHTGMNITDAQFTALVEDLVGALNQFNVPEREKSELLGALGGMKGDIVGH